MEHQHAEDFATARAAGLRLGWTPDWVNTVLHECLAVLLAWHGGTVADLDEQVIEEFDHQLAQSMQLSQSSLRAYRARLASLRQLLFEIGVHDQPPRRRPWSRTLEQRFAEVTMADPIRAVAAALRRRPAPACCVLAPWSPWSTTSLPFAEFLTAQHPDVTSLRGLQRSHVEEFLVWNRDPTLARPQGTTPPDLGRGRPVNGAQPAEPARGHRRLGLGRGTHRAGWCSPPTSPSSTVPCHEP